MREVAQTVVQANDARLNRSHLSFYDGANQIAPPLDLPRDYLHIGLYEDLGAHLFPGDTLLRTDLQHIF